MIWTLALALQAAAPQPAELRTFQDWIAGCDNGRACQAVSLADAADENWVTLSLRRTAAGDAEPVISLYAFDNDDYCGATLVADGQRLPVRLIEAAQCTIVHPADAPALIAALRSARELRVLDPAGADLGRVSLAGASAAMLYLDEAQQRIGTATALVRPGSRPASVVPAPPVLPEVRLAAPAPGDTPQVDAARIVELRREAGCTIDEVGGPDDYNAMPLEDGKTLVLLACGSGAYNVTWVPFIAQAGRGGGVDIAIAQFDRQWSLGDAGRPELVNAEWDSSSRLLTEFPRGRGLGDCGTRSTYGWDGARFRLVRQSTMGECRGAYDYITVWRTRVVRP